jgi:nucleotide-binding universal stress UspA family protein
MPRRSRITSACRCESSAWSIPSCRHRSIELFPREIEAATKHGETVGERRRRILAELLRQAVAKQSSVVDAGYELLEGDPPEQLISASSGLDLLVLGSRCYGPLRHVLLGGVSAAVTRGAHCPTIVVPRGEAQRESPRGVKTAAISADRG